VGGKGKGQTKKTVILVFNKEAAKKILGVA